VELLLKTSVSCHQLLLRGCASCPCSVTIRDSMYAGETHPFNRKTWLTGPHVERIAMLWRMIMLQATVYQAIMVNRDLTAAEEAFKPLLEAVSPHCNAAACPLFPAMHWSGCARQTAYTQMALFVQHVARPISPGGVTADWVCSCMRLLGCRQQRIYACKLIGGKCTVYVISMCKRCNTPGPVMRITPLLP
jgi:hypothetical protein